MYSRFASKDELFFALFDQWREQRTRDAVDNTLEHASFEDFMRGEAQRMARLRREHPNWYLLILEFWTYAVRDPRLREEFARRHDATAHAVVALLERAAQRYGVKIRLPTLEIARAGLAMFYGFTLERLADPAEVPEALLESMFAMLAHEAVGGAAQSKRRSPAKKWETGKLHPLPGGRKMEMLTNSLGPRLPEQAVTPYETLRQRHLRDMRARLPAALARLDWSAAQLKAERETRLRDLVRFAKERSLWHRQRLAHIDSDTFTVEVLNDIPPMSNDDLMEHFNEVVTDPALTLEVFETHLAGLTTDAYLLDRYHVNSSGGSSGRRGVVVYD